jgi:hypothetical protein
MTIPEKMSARSIGKQIRNTFLQKVMTKGIRLQLVDGTIYRSASGARIGIAVATEREPDRWFLGLSQNSFSHAVLLCKHDRGVIIEICLPAAFFERYGKLMSISNGQMKFNVIRRGNSYAVRVPFTDEVSVSEYISDYSILS